MKFPFTCSACGYANHFDWSQIGQQITCGGCEKPMTVPVPMEVVGPAPPPLAVTFRCPSCRRKYSTKPGMAGKKIRCSGCGKGIRVPEGDQGPVGQTSRTETNRDAWSDDRQAPAQPARGPGADSTRVRRLRMLRFRHRRCSTNSVGPRRRSARRATRLYCRREPS